MKTTTQLGLAAVALFACSAIGLGSIGYFLYESRDDRRVVNAAGTIRGGAQRLVKLELSGQQSDESIDQIDKLINGLINGDKELGLPAVTDSEVLAQTHEIADSWSRLKAILVSARANPNQQNALIQESENHWNLTNDGLLAAEVWAQRKNYRYQQIILVVFLIDLLLYGIILWLIFRGIWKIQHTLETIASSSTAMTETITEQETIASQQAIAVNQTNITIERLKNFFHHSVAQAIQVSQSASEAKNLVQSGQNNQTEILSEMGTLNAKVEQLQREIMELRQNTQQIANISELVSELASHTNILALNASMEATRAGEHGKEFAVVAEEIRKLANQSKKAAEKIYILVLGIQTSIKSTLGVTNEIRNIGKIRVNRNKEISEYFQEFVKEINTIFASSEEITLTAREQAAILEQMFDSIQEITRATQESAVAIARAKNEMQQLQESVTNLDAIV